MKRGQTLSEYLLIVAAIAVIVVGGYRLFETHMSAIVGGVDQALVAGPR